LRANPRTGAAVAADASRDTIIQMAEHAETCTCSECGAPTALLDFGYQAPDCVWAQLPHERSPENTSDFARLGERRFVRGLLPIKLESGEEFCFGLWFEVDLATYDQVRACWRDPPRYLSLRFTATIANATPPWRESIIGCIVDLGARKATSRPYVIGARDPWLRQLLESGWTASDYDAATASFG
jgi:hypothetical protein